MSWVGKIFADRDIVGIVYTNFDNKTSRWNSFLQIYDHNGTFLKEAPLENFSSTYERPDIYYDRNKKLFIVFLKSQLALKVSIRSISTG